MREEHKEIEKQHEEMVNLHLKKKERTIPRTYRENLQEIVRPSGPSWQEAKPIKDSQQSFNAKRTGKKTDSFQL